ncbi:hypothetical protein DM02DRAFT_283148 [Periconia macrospinosa]|uniref:Uncharacterized protein n=1 Tax=Periconia macrospinosa TaxID=97972 RepID=A0A2V1EAI1_9PLEO|nr:hypothetical protein DM02DRAFT_283148 [Periconia macrospinosa]
MIKAYFPYFSVPSYSVFLYSSFHMAILWDKTHASRRTNALFGFSITASQQNAILWKARVKSILHIPERIWSPTNGGWAVAKNAKNGYRYCLGRSGLR